MLNNDLHADLRELELGPRQGFFVACDLDAMGAFQDWGPGVAALRIERPDLADWADAAMTATKKLVAERNLVMAELWSGPRTGGFKLPSIEHQLALTGTPKP